MHRIRVCLPVYFCLSVYFCLLTKHAHETQEEAKRRPTSSNNTVNPELEAKEARLAAARKALEDARALSSSLSTSKDASSAAQVGNDSWRGARAKSLPARLLVVWEALGFFERNRRRTHSPVW